MSPEPKSKKQRIQLDLSEAQQAQLVHIRDEHDMQSYSEVFRRAMQVYGRILDEQKAGRTFGLFNEETNVFTEIIIL